MMAELCETCGGEHPAGGYEFDDGRIIRGIGATRCLECHARLTAACGGAVIGSHLRHVR